MALPDIFMEAVKYAPALVSAFTQNRETGAEKQQRALLAQRQDYIRQASDPNSPLYQSQLGIETGNIQRDYAKAIEEITRNQRRGMNMGRTSLLDPERADETLSRLTNEGYVQAGLTGRKLARDNILNMADSAGRAAQGYNSLVGPQAERIKNRSSILTNLAQAGVDWIGSQSETQDAGRTIADIFRDRNAGMGGQNEANQKYNQSAQLMVPRYQRGYV